MKWQPFVMEELIMRKTGFIGFGSMGSIMLRLYWMPALVARAGDLI